MARVGAGSIVPGRERVLYGIGLSAGAYFVFSLQDACVKLLVADLPVAQVMFVRSAVILASCLLMDRGVVLRSLRSPVLWPLVLRGFLLIAAWFCYYSAARWLQLAEMVTIYYASPLLVAVLAIPMLGERVPALRWIAIALGFVGVLLACRPGDMHEPVAVGLALMAAVLWAFAVILIRKLARAEPTLVQMFLASIVFFVVCATAMPWVWKAPNGEQILLLLAVGTLAAGAQYLLYEGFKHAPASVAAPIEFTGLLWAFVLGFLIWGDIPAWSVFGGAAFILTSAALIVSGEWRTARRG